MTTDWAPKPSAIPPMPAPAMSGPRSIPSWPRTVREAKVQITAAATLRSTRLMVRARASARSDSFSSMRTRPGPRSRSDLSRSAERTVAMLRVNRAMARWASLDSTQARATMKAMRMGRSRTHSAPAARKLLPVQSQTRSHAKPRSASPQASIRP